MGRQQPTNMVGWRRRIRYLQRRERNRNHPLNQCRLNKQTHISVIHQDKHGDLWLGTHKHGVAIYHPDTKRITCIGDDKDGSLDILCFYEDTDGKYG